MVFWFFNLTGILAGAATPTIIHESGYTDFIKTSRSRFSINYKSKNQKTEKPNFFVFLGFLKKPKKPWFFKMDVTSPEPDAKVCSRCKHLSIGASTTGEEYINLYGLPSTVTCTLYVKLRL
jgi:hypothetical protein